MKAIYKITVVLLLILFTLSCSGKDDKNEPCKDAYIISLFSDCQADFLNEIVSVSLEEGERLKGIINSSSENCFIINGIDLDDENFEGLIRTNTTQEVIEFFDCSEFCPLCDFLPD